MSRCMCGAMDCRYCHPEGMQYPECKKCGNEFEATYSDDELCEDCEGSIECPCCDEWVLEDSLAEYTFKEGNTELLCEECRVTAKEEGQ